MRNFLTTKDIARLSGYSRAQIWNKAKAGKIPGEQVKYCGKRVRFIDSPEIRAWCEYSRLGVDRLILRIIQGTVLGVIEHDYRANPDRFIVQEICRKLDESDDPDQLLEKWKRAKRDSNREDGPRLDLAHIGSGILGEILRQLIDSEDPKELLTKWARALADGRFEDLPRVP